MTDTTALAQHRARAQPDALFLHHAAADEIEDRLNVVNKSFTDMAVVSGFPDLWSARLPQSQPIPEGEVLEMHPSSQDLVVHAMALHWANDPIGQLIQCRRALRADGLFLGVCFGGQTLQELRACLAEAEAALTGGMSPRVAPMAELRDLGGLLQRAGFALPVADALPLTVSYRNIWHLMHDLRAMGENNALFGRLRHPSKRAIFEAAATLYQDSFADTEGRITATFELIFLTGWAPDASQPKPLRPGSAKQRLSDALNTGETKLPI
jgi:SAM-dependent methyltransferase